MKFSILTAIAAIAGIVSAATEPDYSQPPTGNPIFTPGLNEQVPAGEPYEITWDPTTPGDVSITLLRGPSNNVVPIALLADSIPNTGSYIWTPSTDLEGDETGYGLLIVVEGTGQYQYSTQFGIENDAAPSSEPPVTTPTYAVSPPVVTSYPIQTLTTTLCPPEESPAPTSTPIGTAPTGYPTEAPSSYVSPTPSASPIVPPPFEDAAGRTAVSFAAGAVVALAAVLAF